MEQNTTFEDWGSALKSYFKHRSVFDAKTLNDRLDETPLATLLWHSAVLSNLAGRDSLAEEHTDAILPPWLRLSFLEAIAFLRRKLVIPIEDYSKMEEGYHTWAFSVARIAKLDLLEKIKKSLLKAQNEGTPFEDWRDNFQEEYENEYGTTPTHQRAYTIFDTNIRSAHGTGRGQQMKQISDRSPGEYVAVWRWRDSPNPRLNHQRLHNKAIPYNHKFWQKCAIPAGFGCRCTVSLLKRSLAEQMGIEILNNPPNPETIAEKGFRYPNWGIPDAEAFKKQKQWADEINTLAEED